MSTTEILELVNQRNPNEPEFLQAAEEVIQSVLPVLEKNPRYIKLKLLERMLEPERLISFRVTWMDDQEEVQREMGALFHGRTPRGTFTTEAQRHRECSPLCASVSLW